MCAVFLGGEAAEDEQNKLLLLPEEGREAPNWDERELLACSGGTTGSHVDGQLESFPPLSVLQRADRFLFSVPPEQPGFL